MKRAFNVIVAGFLAFVYLTHPESTEAAIPTNGLVAKYDFSGNANDSVGSVNGIVYGASLAFDRFGNANSAYRFDGFSNYIEIPDNDVFSITSTGALSISAWVRPDGTSLDGNGNLLFSNKAGSGYVYWMGKGTGLGTAEEWAERIYSADNTDVPNRGNRTSYYVFNPSGGTGTGSYVQERLTPGVWLHFVAVVDDSSMTITWYKNGMQRDQDYYGPGAAAPVMPANGTAPVRIGTRDFFSYFAGAVDDIRIYNRVLSQSEIQQLYAEDVPEPSMCTVLGFALMGLLSVRRFGRRSESGSQEPKKQQQCDALAHFPSNNTSSTRLTSSETPATHAATMNIG